MKLFVQVMFWLYLVVVLLRAFTLKKATTYDFIALFIDIGIMFWAYSLLIN